jgi:hypothetical protein
VNYRLLFSRLRLLRYGYLVWYDTRLLRYGFRVGAPCLSALESILEPHQKRLGRSHDELIAAFWL